MCGFRINVKPLFLGILGPNGPKIGHFRISDEKVKTSTSYPCLSFFKKSKNHKIPMHGKYGGRRHMSQREKGELIGPNPPGGHGTKN